MKGVPNVTPGTSILQLIPFQEVVDGALCQYEALAFQVAYRDFSAEEIRLEDYRQGNGVPPQETNPKPFGLPDMGGLSSRFLSAARKKMDLYVSR